MKKLIITAILIAPFALYVSGQTSKTKPKAPASAPATLQASIARGKSVYAQTCITCHQVDGGGVPSLNPPLIKTSYVLGDKSRLIKIVLKGFNEDVEIEGDTYSNTMPPLATLKDQEIADVLTYVRNNFGNKASAVSAAQVKTVRAGK